MSHHYSGPDFGFPQGDARPECPRMAKAGSPVSEKTHILRKRVRPKADGTVHQQQLDLFTNGRITSDGVSPHRDMLYSFPYLGAPHPTPEGLTEGDACPTTTPQSCSPFGRADDSEEAGYGERQGELGE
jgi:hypothetical protein